MTGTYQSYSTAFPFEASHSQAKASPETLSIPRYIFFTTPANTQILVLALLPPGRWLERRLLLAAPRPHEPVNGGSSLRRTVASDLDEPVLAVELAGALRIRLEYYWDPSVLPVL